MNIALTTIGSRGDIQPYIALGIRLQNSGHFVAVLTHPWAKRTVNRYGLTHISIGNDFDINDSAKQFVENSSNNLKGFLFSLHFIFDKLRNCHSDFLQQLKNFDLIIGHGIVGEAEAEMLGKPFITVSIAPMGLSKEYWKSRNILRELGVYLSDKMLGAFFGKPYRHFRKDLGLPPKKTSYLYPYLAIIPMPVFLQKSNPNWKKSTEITGFFFAETPPDYSPPEDLLTFIENGEKPILVTFGSMFHSREQTNHLFRTVCDATKESTSRAILIMPDLGDMNIHVPENIVLVNQIPYSWLLSQVELVVHHFGFGTTAEVLKAGLPSIPIPHIFDQKIRASAIHKMGFTYKPLNINQITGRELAGAIAHVKSNQEMKKKCMEAGLKISNEKGTDKAVELIHHYTSQLPPIN
jgi:sterol 3beta-glucosyltransferase